MSNFKGWEGYTGKPAKRTETPHSERRPKTGATIGAKAERASGAATGLPRAQILYHIGVDPGTHTGLCIIRGGNLKSVETTTIFAALSIVSDISRTYGSEMVAVRFEDARLRKWFGKSGPEKWKGAGSIMRDCAIWEEALTELGIPFEKVPPKEVKETTADQFEKLTGWKARTSIHAREAAWLVLPFLKPKNI